MKLAKDIIKLIYDNDCVIVPGLGGFIANKKPAEINLSGKYAIINSRVILFNSQLTSNDGLLANHLVTQNSISYNEAIQRIEHFVAEVNVELQKRRNAELSGLGTFYLTKEEKLVFIPYHSVNFDKKAYGLPKLRLTELENRPKEVSQAYQKPVIETVATTKEVPAEAVTTETVTVVEEFREDKRDERLQALQSRREQRMAVRARNRKRLGAVNILGSLLLLAVAVGVINFEMSNSVSVPVQEAGMVDTPSTQTDVISEVEEIGNPLVEENAAIVEYTTYAICIAKVNSEKEAVEIANNLNPKFAQSRVEQNEDGSTGVFIISFSNQNLALEYKEFLEQNLRQTLIIKTK